MKRVLSTIIAASLLSAAPALAGINPANPGLPPASTVNGGGLTYAGLTAVPNNNASSMCVDCHSVQPKAGGSHYVNPTSTVGATNSGGSGTDLAAGARDNGAYFKASLWNANGAAGAQVLSKYGNGSALSVSTNNTVPGTRTTATVAASALGGYDIICESCHNIIVNEAGGNNLVATQPSNDFWNAGVAEICVGCHGFMYTTNTTNAGTNYSITGINANEVGGGHKSNNEFHWVKGVKYPQNHHVMTGDVINSAVAAQRLLWTDNDVVSYTETAISTASTQGTLPQRAAWAPIAGGQGFAAKPSTVTNLSCTNCHTPAHGFNGSPGASILRNATYTTAAVATLGPIARISDRGGWKKIQDGPYCGQCHNVGP